MNSFLYQINYIKADINDHRGVFFPSSFPSASKGAAAAGGSSTDRSPAGREHSGTHVRRPCFRAALHHERPQQQHSVSPS